MANGREEDELDVEQTLQRPGAGARELTPPPSAARDVELTAAGGAAPTRFPGTQVPHIEGVTITGTLGTGGQGVVFKGHQEYLDRPVAVKVLHRNIDPSFSQRFQREAKILAGLGHPNIVACHQAGVTDDDHCYMVMEFIDGPDLQDRVSSRGPLEPEAALAMTRELALALQHGQEAAIIHRDVKPQNVLLQQVSGAGMRAKLADLGLARCSEDSGEGPELTTQGSVMGTPTTMAPEQFDAPESVDHRADIYGLGCVLFFALTGKPAFEGKTLTELYRKKTAREMPRRFASETLVPESLRPLIVSMLAASPDDRPADYGALIDAIDAVSRGERLDLPGTSGAGKRGVWIAAGVMVLAGGGLLAALSMGGDDEEPDPDPRTATVSPAPTIDAPPTPPVEHTADENPEPAATQDPEPAPAPPPFLPPIREGARKPAFGAATTKAELLSDWEHSDEGAFLGFDGPDGTDFSHVRAVYGDEGIRWVRQLLPEGGWTLTGWVGVQKEFGAFDRPYKAGVGFAPEGDDGRCLYLGVIAPHVGMKATSADVVLGWADLGTCTIQEELVRVPLELGKDTVQEVAAAEFSVTRSTDGTFTVRLQRGEPVAIDADTARLNSLRLTTCNGMGSWRGFAYEGR